MASFLRRLFTSSEPSSKEIAKERLQLVLVHDRSNLSPEQVEKMKDEILEVISHYVDFDRNMVNIHLTNEDRDSILHAEIPIQPGSPRRRRASTA